MIDILKITSPVSQNGRVGNLPKQLPTDAIFDILNPNASVLVKQKAQGVQDEGSRQTLLHNLNKEIFEPLMNSTRAQSDNIRKLVLMAKLFETSSGTISEDFLDRVFIRPQEMMKELLIRDKGETIFKGEFFDSLRILSKFEGQPRLQEAITSILKYFDCFVNQDNELKAIIKQSKNLAGKLLKSDKQLLEPQIERLDTLIRLNKGNQKEIKSFLKNEFVPLLGQIVKKNQSSDRVHDPVMTIIHYIVRYDRADPKQLEAAVFQLGEELKPLTNLTGEDILEMKKLVFEEAAKTIKMGDKLDIDKNILSKFGIMTEDSDMATLLTKALDREGPSKINSIAQNLLMNMLQSESPVLAMMHFIIPFRYLDENTYGEFFIDKDCKERKGDSKEAKNIFFTIQSDKYGNFEVDLLARDKKIDLDIKCPDILLGAVKETKIRLKDIIEEQGYKLTNYRVGVYQESKSIMQRFPKLALRKVGIDVKI